MSFRRTPSGDLPASTPPFSLDSEAPQFRWWLAACAVSVAIWMVAGWLIWLLVSWLLSLR